jgi:hypothetical protein
MIILTLKTLNVELGGQLAQPALATFRLSQSVKRISGSAGAAWMVLIIFPKWRLITAKLLVAEIQAPNWQARTSRETFDVLRARQRIFRIFSAHCTDCAPFDSAEVTILDMANSTGLIGPAQMSAETTATP